MPDAPDTRVMRSLGVVLRTIAHGDDELSPEMAEALVRLASLDGEDCAVAVSDDADRANQRLLEQVSIRQLGVVDSTARNPIAEAD